MELSQLSLDTFAAICLVIATPWVYRTFRPFSTERSTKTLTEQTISTLLLFHTLYLLYNIFVSPPQNIFKAFGLGLDAPPEHLRIKLLESYGGEQNFPEHLHLLLKRLGLMDLRSLYVRFGHEVLTTCSYCHSYDDFALYAFPAPLLEYIREIAFVGLLTLTHSPTTAFRPLGLGALLISLLTEAYWTLTVQVIIPTIASPNLQVPMWHDNFVQYRNTLFLVLPLLLTILPSLGLHRLPIIGAFFPAPESTHVATLGRPQYQLPGQNLGLPPNATLGQTSTVTLQTLQHLVPTLHLLKYTHAAIMRSQASGNNSEEGEASALTTTTTADSSAPPAATSMLARATQWWNEEAREGGILRNDEGVRNVLKLAGLGLNKEVKDDSGDTVVQPEGQLLSSARMAVTFLKENGARPSQYWMQ